MTLAGRRQTLVSEPLVDDASRQETGPAGNGLEFEIVDQTSAEQVTREQKLLAPAGQTQSTIDSQARVEPESRLNAEPQVQPESDSETQQQSAAESQQVRTYSQTEVSKMQAAWSRQIEDARQSASKAGEQLQQFNLDAAVEAMLKKQESELTARVGTEKAGQLARSPENTALVRQSITNQQLLQRSEAERTQAMQQQEQQARFIVAQSLAREYGVAPGDFELLASAATPKAMQGLARRLGGQGVDAMRNRVPTETSQTQLENGYHAGPQPENTERRLERIRAKPSWEWTEADLRYMKTGEVR